MKHQIFFLALSIMLYTHSIAQDTTAIQEIEKKKKIEFAVGIGYNSSLNYYGRTDSMKSKGIYPFAALTFSNGIYLKSNFIFINNALGIDYAASIAEAGVNFKNKKENVVGNVFASKYFYNQNSSLPQSAIKAQAGINLSYLNKAINLNAGADAKFSNNIDAGVYVGVDHIQRFDNFLGNGVLVFDPSFYVYAGTQHFSKTYYQKKSVLGFPVDEEAITKDSKQFNILAFEASVPIVYALGKMNLIIVPAYVLPQNIVETSTQSQQAEKAANLFYITGTIKFTF